MKIDHPERIAEMVVCRECRDVVGPFWPMHGALVGEGPLLQRGRCELHPPRPHAASWPRFDFNRGVDLCYCCGLEPLASGSKWSVWFCHECKDQVGLLNARHGRCIVPIGRHSVHWGCLLRAEDVSDPIVLESFTDAAKAAGSATNALAGWHDLVVGLNLDAIGASPSVRVPIDAYTREVAGRVDPMDRFRRMCLYLDARGRQLVMERDGADR